jgi:hypothetical protein
MKLDRDLYIQHYNLLYLVTAVALTMDEANAHMAEHPGEGLLCVVEPFHFIAKKTDKGRDRPREIDGAPMIKVEGYANAETHAVVLDINNDEARQTEYINLARNAWRKATGGGASLEGLDLVACRKKAQLALADTMSERLDDGRPKITNRADIYSTLMSTALGRVEWMEVADEMLIKMEETDLVQPTRESE